MKYKILITKEIENPNYDPEAVKEYMKNKGSNYGYAEKGFDPVTMDKTRQVEALTTDLTEAEFQKIKKSVLEVM